MVVVQKSGTFTITSGSGTNKTVDKFIVYPTTKLDGLTAFELLIIEGLRASQGVSAITCVQVALLEGPFCDTHTAVGLLTRMLTSTGVQNYNDIDGMGYSTDTLPEQLGCGIPQELLGSTWCNGIAALGSGQSAQGTLMVIDAPTRLWDLIKVELILRRIHLVWRNGTIQAVTWATPTASTNVWDFTESNKAAPAGQIDAQRVPTETTDEFVVNIIKISYNRTSDGKYRDTLTVMDPTAMGDSGGTGRILNLEARNSWGGFIATGQAIETLAIDVATWLPLFSRPLKRLHRSFAFESICQLAPGDQANVTDSFARDPSTGIRGMVAKPALITSATWDLGGPNSSGGQARDFSASCELLMLPTDRISAYSPCAEVDYSAGGGGYNAGTKVLTCWAHHYSLSSEIHDAARFLTGHVVRVVEQDPANAAAPQTWLDVVASQTGDTITLTTGLGGFSATTRYMIRADHYGADTAAQKANVFQGNSGTNLIESVADAYQYGYGASNSPVSWTEEDPATPPALYSQYDYGDGYPLTPGGERDVAQLVNNLVNYRTATLNPSLRGSVFGAPASTYIRALLCWFPVYVGPGDSAGRVRYLTISPFARNTHAASQTLTVHLCRRPPIGTGLTLTAAAITPEYAVQLPYVSAPFTLAGGAGWAVLGAQQLDTRVCEQLDGTAWVVIEGTGDATGGIQTRGLAGCFVGPLQDA
jgi:hypothetical protein